MFLRNFFGKDGKVDTDHGWVWMMHFVSYVYIIYIYFFTDLKKKESSEFTKMWIPLDIILTFNIALYYSFFVYMQYWEDLEHHHEHGKEC